MNDHALAVLEFQRIREILVAHAATELGREAARELEPLSDDSAVRERLEEAREMVGLLAEHRLPLAGLADVAGQLRSLAEGGRPGEPELLHDLLRLLRGCLSLKAALTSDPDRRAHLATLGRPLHELPALRQELEDSLDVRGGLRDEATERLLSIRGELRSARDAVRNRIQRLRGEARLQKALQSEGVKFKNDRYLLSVRSEFRQHVPGVIRDRSASGSTLYIEPEELVEAGDHLLALLDQERDEVQRILWRLTREALEQEGRIRENQERAARADLARAKALYAGAFGLTFPEITRGEPGEGLVLELRDARHPYLMWMHRDAERELEEDQTAVVHERVVPLDLRLGCPRRLVLITGPNTGGKTVALKTIGLAVLMAGSGLPVAAAPGARVPRVSSLHVDIGDEQSIEQSLSTFSSHLTHLREILDEADERSLILLDELGAGTDPLEGAALATALLDHFRDRGWHAIITTHLTSLKEYAFSHEEVENAAMEFDHRTLEPTFRLVTGIPGRSHALEIARRIGLPDELIEQADRHVERVQAPTRELIEKMTDSHVKLEKERRRMVRLRQRAQGERRAAEAEREEAQVEREILRQEADEFVDETLRRARERLHPLLKQLCNLPRGLQQVADDLRCAVELLLTGTPLGARREEFARTLRKDDEVFVPRFRQVCRVRKVNKGERRVTVMLNGIPTAISFDDVTWVTREAPGPVDGEAP